MINENKWSKTIEWERLEISSRKLEKPRDIHANMGTTNDRNHMDLREAKDIKKGWQEYTEELDKKILITQITTMMWTLT